MYNLNTYSEQSSNWSVTNFKQRENNYYPLRRKAQRGGFALLAAKQEQTPALSAEDLAEESTSHNNFYVDNRSLLIDQLRQYEFLESGWDGSPYDVAPTRAALEEAIEFLEYLPTFVDLPEPMVSADGEVGFFWNSLNFYLDVGFRGRGDCSFFGKSREKKIKGRASISPQEAIPPDLLSFITESVAQHEMHV